MVKYNHADPLYVELLPVYQNASALVQQKLFEVFTPLYIADRSNPGLAMKEALRQHGMLPVSMMDQANEEYEEAIKAQDLMEAINDNL